MVYLVTAAVLIGGLYGRLPSAVAARVFADGSPPLLGLDDLRRPWAVHEPTPARATGVQIVFAVLCGATALAVGTIWVVIAYVWFVGVTMTLTITDMERKLIPNRILFPGTAAALVLLGALALVDGEAANLPRAVAGGAA